MKVQKEYFAVGAAKGKKKNTLIYREYKDTVGDGRERNKI